jgi:hypothetical protein
MTVSVTVTTPLLPDGGVGAAPGRPERVGISRVALEAAELLGDGN